MASVNAPPATRTATVARSILFDRNGLEPKWRVLLFLAGIFLVYPHTGRVANWLVAHRWMTGLDGWTAAQHLAFFAAIFITTVAAAWLERRSLADYGLPWMRAFGARFWEGAAWGSGVTTLQVALLQATHSVSFHSSGLGARTGVAFCGRWALTTLAIALFEECLKRGYLQFALGRSMGFWHAAVLLACLFGLEKLFDPAYREVIAFVSVVFYGLLVCLTLRLTGSLWFAIGFHGALEWTAVFVFGLSTPILHHPQGTLLTPALRGPAWMTGAHNGLVSSILTPLALAGVWIALQARFRPAAAAAPDHAPVSMAP